MNRLMPNLSGGSKWGRLVTATAILPLALLLAACPKSTAHRAREAVADIASGLQSVEQVTEALYQQKAITPAEGQALSTYLILATRLNDQGLACVKNGGNDMALVAVCVQPIVDQMKQQEAVAVLKIENPRSRSKFETALTGVDAGLSVLQGILKGAVQ